MTSGVVVILPWLLWPTKHFRDPYSVATALPLAPQLGHGHGHGLYHQRWPQEWPQPFFGRYNFMLLATYMTDWSWQPCTIEATWQHSNVERSHSSKVSVFAGCADGGSHDFALHTHSRAGPVCPVSSADQGRQELRERRDGPVRLLPVGAVLEDSAHAASLLPLPWCASACPAATGPTAGLRVPRLLEKLSAMWR